MTTVDNRNYGIDLLRIVCLFGVVILHLLGHGGVLQTAVSGPDFSTAWLWETVAYPAVNCFVLISGFVGYRGERYYPKLHNLISLFLVVVFYSVLFQLGFQMLHPQEISITSIIKAFLPVTTKQYWFFTAYFAMVLVSPMLNLFVHQADSGMMLLTVAVTLLLAIPSTVNDPFILSGGYSFVWFSLVYVLGAMIKKANIPAKLSTAKTLALLLVSLLMSWFVKIVFHLTDFTLFGVALAGYEDSLISYCSPTILLAAACMLCLFSKLKVDRRFHKVISFFAASAFSVYLIHDNRLVRAAVISNRFAFINAFDPVLTSLLIVGCALGIFLACSLIDKLRLMLFQLLRVSQLSIKLEGVIKSAIQNLSAVWGR